MATAALLCGTGAALAVPSFARQTGVPCSGCHVGAFGPQLTEFGVQFKLGGYTFSRSGELPVPVSAMAIASYTRTSKSLPDPLPDHVKANNNLVLDQASLFLAGRLSEHVGVFSQLTYDGIGRKAAIDEVDLRYARSVTWGEHSAIVGLSVNNSPASSDPYNALPNWGFPFVSSAIAPTPDAGTLLDGALAQRVIGASVYTQLDGRWYAEAGTYRSLSPAAQTKLGLGRADDPGILSNAFYGRVAAQHAWGDHALSGGVVAFNTGIRPDRSASDRLRYRDLGVDLSYRWTVAPNQTFTLLSNVVRERQDRSAMVDAGTASLAQGAVTESSLTASYSWNSTYGLSLQRFALHGRSDELFYADGFANGSPNWSGTRLQFDWTPFGKQALQGGLEPQWRLGVQYTAYNKFNGASTNYDGSGRNAKDNNSLFLFSWLMF